MMSTIHFRALMTRDVTLRVRVRVRVVYVVCGVWCYVERVWCVVVWCVVSCRIASCGVWRVCVAREKGG